MSAQRRPEYNPENPTIPAAAVRSGPLVAAAAIVRSSGVVMRSVPLVYDAADDGDELHATELFNVDRVPGTPAPPNRNFGGTALMPAAFSIEMRAAIAASLQPLEAEPSTPQASPSGTRASGERRAKPAPLPTMGLSRFEIGFGISAAVIVGVSAALLFVYFL